jgi:hypothetical protein
MPPRPACLIRAKSLAISARSTEASGTQYLRNQRSGDPSCYVPSCNYRPKSWPHMCRRVSKGPERNVWVYLIICIVASRGDNAQRCN